MSVLTPVLCVEYVLVRDVIMPIIEHEHLKLMCSRLFIVICSFIFLMYLNNFLINKIPSCQEKGNACGSCYSH